MLQLRMVFMQLSSQLIRLFICLFCCQSVKDLKIMSAQTIQFWRNLFQSAMVKTICDHLIRHLCGNM